MNAGGMVERKPDRAQDLDDPFGPSDQGLPDVLGCGLDAECPHSRLFKPAVTLPPEH